MSVTPPWVFGTEGDTLSKSTRTRQSGKPRPSNGKPAKPYPDFPLFPHATRRWAKKIRGKLHYFGPWDDPDAALQKYLSQRDDLHAGRTPRIPKDGFSIRDLCNRFLTAKQRLLESGEITDRTFADYYRTCDRLVNAFDRQRLVEDLAADDFEHFRATLAKTLGPVALSNEIGRVRVVFKFAWDSALVDQPVRYGQGFRKPSKKTLRLARAKGGKRMFEADEVQSLIKTGSQPLTTMILLGINCGLGQSDCANLPHSALDLESGWLDFPLPKTGVERRCPLWPETIEALSEAIEQRPEPRRETDADLVFVTKYGNRWVRLTEKEDAKDRTPIDSVSLQFRKLMNKLGLEGRRAFYALRHTFETVAGESRDQVAVNAIMGHVDSSMAAVYRERISGERLQAVVDVVHDWLWPTN